MKLSVNPAQRYAKMRAHTATHLLHAQLGEIFPTTKQAGSMVDSDLLRFDFYAERLLDEFELAKIEKRINQIIYLAAEVNISEMKIVDAEKLGAKMFFEEKYGDQVRVIQILNPELPHEFQRPDNTDYFASLGNQISIELCGGTHVNNTREIGFFTIISQEAVASGIKRITALTGPRAIEKLEDLQGLLSQLTQLLEVKSPTQLPEKLQKLLKESESQKSRLASLELTQIRDLLAQGEKKSDQNFKVKMLVPDTIDFKLLGNEAKNSFAGQIVLLANPAGNFMVLGNAQHSAKDLAQKLGLKGGGNDGQVQGRDPKVLELI